MRIRMYPLRGELERLGLEFAQCVDSSYYALRWSTEYLRLVVGWDEAYEVQWEKAKETNNLREFFATFRNWKTASDQEKAVHIMKWTAMAEYDEQTFNKQYRPELYDESKVNPHAGSAYGCLIEKTAICSGYYRVY